MIPPRLEDHSASLLPPSSLIYNQILILFVDGRTVTKMIAEQEIQLKEMFPNIEEETQRACSPNNYSLAARLIATLQFRFTTHEFGQSFGIDECVTPMQFTLLKIRSPPMPKKTEVGKSRNRLSW